MTPLDWSQFTGEEVDEEEEFKCLWCDYSTKG